MMVSFKTSHSLRILQSYSKYTFTSHRLNRYRVLQLLWKNKKTILENTDELMYRILQSQKTVAINSCCELDCNVFYDTDIDLKAGYDEVIINGFYLPKNAKKRLALKKEA